MAPTLISGLDELYNCPFYWGKIGQKEAEAILKEKPVGSYLVTDAEDENKDHQLELFFVKNSSIIGKSELQFGLDFAASTGDWNFYIACGRQSFMEFLRKHITEFVDLVYPVLRKRPFSLQELARSTIRRTAVAALSFDGISQLELPEKLKNFIKEYKYKDCCLSDTVCFGMAGGILKFSATAASGTVHCSYRTTNLIGPLVSDSDSSEWDSDSEGENEDENAGFLVV